MRLNKISPLRVVLFLSWILFINLFSPHAHPAWAGIVINAAENEEYDRKRGYTQPICVRRPWRRRGLARALLARSFRVLKEQGMTETALGLDARNLGGALRLFYESMGYRVVKQFTDYRKETGPPFAGGQP